MAVNSYPELFTTLIGWQQYQNLWDILVHTGLAFVPFIAMIIKNTVEPFLSQEPKSAYTISLRRVEFSLAAMIITIMIACQPMLTLEPDVLHFQPVCDTAVNATPDNSGTTYDEAFPNIQPAKVPLWWYAIVGLSHGVTAAANVGLGCTPNLREEQIQLHLTRIQSAPLRAEVQQFVNACWLPAWRKYNEKKPDISEYTQQYGSSDPEWIGSHAFLGMPGYYDSFNAPEPIPGFPYDAQRDWAQGKDHGQWGTPNCKEWWSQPQVGLYDQLKAQIDPTLWNEIVSKFGQGNPEDAAIKELVSSSLTAGYQDSSGQVDNLGGGMATGLLAGLGLAWHSMSYFPKMYVMIEALPLIQAYLLMACYIFLAIALPASRYRFGTVLSLSFVIFSIIFWSYLWELAGYVDSAMIQALDPVGGFQMVSKSYGGTPVLTDMVAVLMYIIIPVFWTMFMGWAGVQVGNGVTSLIDRAGAISSGGGAAVGLIGKAASVATKVIK